MDDVSSTQQTALMPTLPSDEYEPRHQKTRRSLKKWIIAATALVVLLAGGVVVVRGTAGAPSIAKVPDVVLPQRTWLSGAWTGGEPGTASIQAFGAWRGSPADVVTTYPAHGTWDELKNPEWHIGIFDGFRGKLSYGMALLPDDDAGDGFREVAQGARDDVWAAQAKALVAHGHPDSYVRVGLEANGEWWHWGATAQTADDFKSAFRHVVEIMKKEAPQLVFIFDIGCGHQLQGGSDRLASLTMLYPGDQWVNIIGCDHYDSYTAKSRTPAEFASAMSPADSAGLNDVVAFARAHHKKFAVPEWGLTSADQHGSGDNPFFIYSMYQFFLANKKDLAYENYFNEPAKELKSSIWRADENPKSAKEYAALW